MPDRLVLGGDRQPDPDVEAAEDPVGGTYLVDVLHVDGGVGENVFAGEAAAGAPLLEDVVEVAAVVLLACGPVEVEDGFLVGCFRCAFVVRPDLFVVAGGGAGAVAELVVAVHG